MLTNEEVFNIKTEDNKSAVSRFELYII